jgi:hypothetical protein
LVPPGKCCDNTLTQKKTASFNILSFYSAVQISSLNTLSSKDEDDEVSYTTIVVSGKEN